MKKIMFSDKYGLTQAVLEGQKTMTRRIIENEDAIYSLNEQEYMNQLCLDKRFCEKYSRYQIGEIVAVAQSYNIAFNSNGGEIVWENGCVKCAIETKGWNNKMFVCANKMPHQILITGIKVEKLQDISGKDCLKEGILDVKIELEDNDGIGYSDRRYEFHNSLMSYETPRGAFAELIDKVCGKGTWESNPFCFCYEFELVK